MAEAPEAPEAAELQVDMGALRLGAQHPRFCKTTESHAEAMELAIVYTLACAFAGNGGCRCRS